MLVYMLLKLAIIIRAKDNMNAALGKEASGYCGKKEKKNMVLKLPLW